MKISKTLLGGTYGASAAVITFAASCPLLGAISTTGDVTPDPNTAGATDTLYVGHLADGSMDIDGGSDVSVATGYIGFARNVTGSATVDGDGSRLRTFGTLTVGRSGDGSLDVLNNASVETENLILGDAATASGELTLNHDTTELFTNNTVTVGKNGTGTLNINTDAGAILSTLYVADRVNSTGTVNVDGAGSSMHTNPIYVGREGHGTLNVTNDGYINASSVYLGWADTSTGDALIDGTDSLLIATSLLQVGVEGTATLNITGGAYASTGNVQIGVENGSTGTVTLEDTGTEWFSGDLQVGVNGTGNLNIRNSAVAHAAILRIGSAATHDGRIIFDNGTLEVSNVLKVSPQDLQGTGVINTQGVASDIDMVFDNTHGIQQQILLNSEPGQNVTINLDQSAGAPLGAGYRAASSLTIRDGITVVSGEGLLGDLVGSTGTATIKGPGTVWENNDGIVVGNEGTGVLTIQGGATVTLDEDLIIANQATSTGTVNLINGTLDLIRNDIKIGQGNGTLNFTGGTLKHARAISADLHQQGGVLALGASVPGLGKSFIGGDYTLTAGTLQMQIAGTANNDYDRLEVSGMTTLGGTLEVLLTNGFTPNLGDSFGFLIALGGYSGDFSELILPDLSAGGLDWLLSPNGSTLFLEVVEASLPGDLDGDGFVGIGDLTLVLSNWNQSVPPADPSADPSGDGFIGIDDLNLVLVNWNTGTPPTTNINIPQPATISIALSGVIALLRSGRG